jgi:NADH-quinone oxidoreductase subunit L
MEAPVPASALIHSATLVSAGVYLVLRFSTLFENTSYAINIIPILGGITAVYGGVVASFQSDVKRILAYSTISHCGFLMVSCLTCVQDFTLFYLYVHGFFKAGVFLCVGNVIRFNKGNQDFRKMGGFFKYMPYECYLTLLGLFNLGGFPFSLGFFMKHTFLVGNSSPIYSLILSGFTSLLCLVAALTGIFYSFRLFYFVFFDFKKGRPAIYKSSNRKKIINSQHFSNTSLASTLSIFGLYFTAYIICYILY